MKNKYYIYGLLVMVGFLIVGFTYAAFTGKSEILGASVSVGSADIRLLDDLTGGTEEANLVAQKSGPVFYNVYPGWSEGYLVKIYNNSPSSVSLSTNANYETALDPEELRQIIEVEPVEWNDINNNGVPDSDEMGATLEKKTIVKWKTEGYDLGTLESGEVKGYMIKFIANAIPDSKQGATAQFDFSFDSIGLE